MSLVVGTQNPNSRKPAQPDYGPFAGHTKGISLPDDPFETLNFLEPQELACAERVCKSWKQFISCRWKRICQNMVDISAKIDPKSYFPEGLSYKQIVKLISTRIHAGSVFRKYIGEIGPVPPIPEAISLKKWNEPDPCDPDETVGAGYAWMYCPPYIETERTDISLDKPDDPNNPEAPKLIQRKEKLEEKFAEIGLDEESEKKALKVPVTFNNIRELFKRPKTGNPSICEYVMDEIDEQHGNKRIPAGWICMRRNVIGRGRKFNQLQTLANEKGVVIPQLLQRILFNFLEKIRSKKPSVYPDGRDPYTFAWTSTLTRDSEGNDWPSGCGAVRPSGLHVDGSRYFSFFVNDHVGVSVALPTEVQAIGP